MAELKVCIPDNRLWLKEIFFSNTANIYVDENNLINIYDTKRLDYLTDENVYLSVNKRFFDYLENNNITYEIKFKGNHCKFESITFHFRRELDLLAFKMRWF